VKVTPGADGRSLVLEGEFSAPGARAVEAPLGALLASLGAGPEPVVLDMAGVPYMDSAGFSGWVGLERRTREAGRELKVARAPALIRELFVFADLEEVLEA